MRRSLLFCLALVILLSATVASASDWYVGARFGGMSNYWLHPYWYDDDSTWPYYYIRHTDFGIFDYREFDVGFRHDSWYAELGLGYSSATWTEKNAQTTEEKVNWYTFSLAGLYTLAEPDPIELDVGLRFQLHSANWDYGVDSCCDNEKISGWSFGPLARARWYFAEGALALGPEVYPKYTSLAYEWDVEGGREVMAEADLTSWDIEYSIRLEWFF